MSNFAIVKFVDEKDAIAVVSIAWVQEDLCYWPPPSADIVKFTKKSIPPNSETWKKCRVKVTKLFGTNLVNLDK